MEYRGQSRLSRQMNSDVIGNKNDNFIFYLMNKEMENLIVTCPHCEDNILIEKINCAIFRHGVFRSNMMQIPPHLPKTQCDELFEKRSIYGCGKPFRLVCNDNKYEAEACDYL